MNVFYDKIEDYLNDELDGESRTDFETALRADPDLQFAVARQREMIERLQAMRLRQKIKENMAPPGSSPAFRKRWLVAVIAALILVAAAIYFRFFTPASKPPANSTPDGRMPAPQDVPSLEKKPPVAENPVLTNPQDLPKTPSSPDIETITADPRVRIACAEFVSHLELVDFEIMGDAQKNPDVEYKLNEAIVLLKNEKPAKAIPLLDTVLAKDNALYREYAEWLSALAWLLRNPVQGNTRLETIASDPAHTYRVDALRLQRRLE